MNDRNQEQAGLAWQIGVWDEISEIYPHEIDRRFIPIAEATIDRAGLSAGESVLDLGTGTGALALRAAAAVGPTGHVVGIDISPHMLAVARRHAAEAGLGNIDFSEGRAEDLPLDDNSVDVVIASLSMMYVIDREAAAAEIARVLRPGGRFVAAVWAAAEECDIVLFQQTAGSFAGPPPVPGVGPGSLAYAGSFLQQLESAGIHARVETQEFGFDFDDFASAWDALAAVTTAHLATSDQEKAREAVIAAMYPNGDGPRHFRNLTQFIIGKAGA